MIYFDHNATTPLLPQARQAWLDAADRYPGNPSSPHRVGARAETALHQARETLAATLDCDPGEILWTSGATESNNTVLHHVARGAGPDGEVWVSAVEHPCVIEALQRYFPERHRFIPVLETGAADLQWLSHQLAVRQPALVALMAANNETGVLQPWQSAANLCREHDVPFFCDAAQWIGKMPPHSLGLCNYLSGCAHKFGGPKGVGFLRASGRLHPLIVGGPQEFKRRAGTENVPGVLSMIAALEACDALRPDNPVRLQWRQRFEQQLAPLGPEVVAASVDRLWNTVSVLMPKADCRRRWVVKLDKLGLAVSTGSACASGKEQPSHVLTAMGYDPNQTDRVLRFSSGWATTESDWDALLEGIRNAVA